MRCLFYVVCVLYGCKSEGKIPIGSASTRWKDNIKLDLEEIE
jgi:hypothetical protein